MEKKSNNEVENLIEGVKIKKLKSIPDERGQLMEILRNDDELFRKFGQVYMTTAYPGVIKAWHYHKKQTDNFTLIKGMAKIVLFDNRPDSPTKGMINEFLLDMHNPLLIQIPEMIYHGFKCVSDEEVIILNIPTEIYNYEDPDEFRIDPHNNDIPYDWKKN